VKCGLWNVRGWNGDPDSDNWKLRKHCVAQSQAHIIAVVETHLKDDNKLDIAGYKWVGQNRKKIHQRAKNGSGGIGVLIKNDININISTLNDSYEGILWVIL
jgi:hypothetical protein